MDTFCSDIPALNLRSSTIIHFLRKTWVFLDEWVQIFVFRFVKSSSFIPDYQCCRYTVLSMLQDVPLRVPTFRIDAYCIQRVFILYAEYIPLICKASYLVVVEVAVSNLLRVPTIIRKVFRGVSKSV
jgi:hypothetical protein